MQIAKHKYVSLDYILKNENGDVIDSSDNSGQLSYIHGMGTIIKGLEEALEGRSQGEKIIISIKPEKAFGAYDTKLLHEVDRENFKGFDDIKVGMRVHVSDNRFNRIMVVTAVKDDRITVDGNHPLAGKEIEVCADIKEVRDATVQELEESYTALRGCQAGCEGSCDDC